jgi:hypothetical protein
LGGGEKRGLRNEKERGKRGRRNAALSLCLLEN